MIQDRFPGDGEFSFSKVRAHARGPADDYWESNLDFQGNQLADAEAKSGADLQAVPQWKSAVWTSRSGEVQALLSLVAGVTARAGDFGDSTGRPAAGSSLPKPRRTGPPPGHRPHELAFSRGAWRCRVCCQYAVSPKAKRALRRRPCTGKMRVDRRWVVPGGGGTSDSRGP